MPISAGAGLIIWMLRQVLPHTENYDYMLSIRPDENNFQGLKVVECF